jgi:hypothetical protein
MLAKIKEFLFGKPTQPEVEVKAEAPYKVEVVPAGTEAPVAAPEANQAGTYKVPEPVTITPTPVVVESIPAKPKATSRTAKPKATPKPKSPRKPVTK